MFLCIILIFLPSLRDGFWLAVQFTLSFTKTTSESLRNNPTSHEVYKKRLKFRSLTLSVYFEKLEPFKVCCKRSKSSEFIFNSM